MSSGGGAGETDEHVHERREELHREEITAELTLGGSRKMHNNLL